MRLRGALVAFVFALGCCLTAKAARASCGAEGCPLEVRGPELMGNHFGFDLGYQYVNQDKLWDGNGEAGPPTPEDHEVETLTRTNSIMGTGRAQFGQRVLVTSTIPYMNRTHTHLVQHHPGFYVPATWNYSGFGDLLTIAQASVLGSKVHDPVSFSVRGGIKLPTGRTNVPEVDGEQPEPSARPGSGSVDWLAGAQVRKLVATKTLKGQRIDVPVSLSGTWRWNGKGTEDYKVGDEVQAALSGGWALSRPLLALLQVNYRHHDSDEPGESGDVSHIAAEESVYLTPGLRGQVTNDIAAFGYWQIRVYEHTTAPELIAPYHLSFGLSYSFAQ